MPDAAKLDRLAFANHDARLTPLRLTGRRRHPAVEGVLNLPEGQECCVVGTVYKEMKLKPNILDEYVKVGLVLRLFAVC
jgi:DNA polymerase delta subunit OB-fold domain